MLLLLLCCSNRCFFLDYQSCLLIQIAHSTVSLYYQKVLNFNNLNTEGFLIKVRQFFYTTSLFLTLSLLQQHYFFITKIAKKQKYFEMAMEIILRRKL